MNQPQDRAKTEVIGSNMDQIPFQAIEAIGAIFAEGEKKYGRDNWKKGILDAEYQRERLNHAILHLQKYANGDNSEKHLAKVAWFCVTQLYFDLQRVHAPITREAQSESIFTNTEGGRR